MRSVWIFAREFTAQIQTKLVQRKQRDVTCVAHAAFVDQHLAPYGCIHGVLADNRGCMDILMVKDRCMVLHQTVWSVC